MSIFLVFSTVFFMVSEFRGPEDAFEPFGGPKVTKSITFFPKQSLPLWGPSYDSLNSLG